MTDPALRSLTGEHSPGIDRRWSREEGIREYISLAHENDGIRFEC